MPYVITTHDAELLYGGRTTDTRHAVATLEQARRTVRKAYEDAHVAGAISAMTAITEAGGTVGPLPDGTVIEVERVTKYELAARPEWPNGWVPEHDEFIPDQCAAYNAAQGA